MSNLYSENLVALVTGSAKRIGAAIAKGLHAAGYDLVLHYRDSQLAAESLAAELNHQRANSAICIQANFDQHDSIKMLAEKTMAQWQRLDLLVNNASMFYPTPLADASLQDWNSLFNSNLQAPYFLIQALADVLQKSKGSIINIADIYADKPLGNHSLYCMVKAGNVMMTKSLALELAPDVRVNGIAPGAILWPESAIHDTQKILDKIPMNQLGGPDEIVNLVLFLANKTHYMTGQIINVDGGRTLNI
ncbi:MAG: pteridine reductase [Cellvibrio sp.]|nr:pteridine reductase [Cellvibrio sp.]